MSGSSIIEWIRLLGSFLRNLVPIFWTGVALVFDLMRRFIDGWRAGLLIVLFSALAYFTARRLQKILVDRLKANPKDRVPIWKLDARLSLPVFLVVLFILPALLVFWAIRWVIRAVIALFRKKKQSDDAPPPPKEPYVVATLGPTYLLSALIMVALYLVGLLTEPLLAARLGLSPGAPAWQYLFLGHRPELIAYLPLGTHPWSGGLITFLFWLTLWSSTGRLVRLIFQSDLGRNLHAPGASPSTKSWWQDRFAADDLTRPMKSYRDWATRLIWIAAPFLLWSWLSVASNPYRLPSSAFAVAFLVWLSWWFHLRLKGEAHAESKTSETKEEAVVEAAGWPAVLADLRSRFQVGEPLPSGSPRPLTGLEPRENPQRGLPLISPLLLEVMKDDLSELTPMQFRELIRLSQLGHVHTSPPPVPGELTLEVTADSDDRLENEKRRNRIVLAPEGAGKTTLAMLAASNQVLVHTRSTLIVVPGESEAQELQNRFRLRLQKSTMRWNIRLRRIGNDLVNDLAQGIFPDVVITDLRSLVVSILHETRRYRPFLSNVGLVVVDDAESFAGAVEIHARLAFRRLNLVFRELLGVSQLGERNAPMFLVLATASMHKTETWIKSLCGIEAKLATYYESDADLELREAAARAASGLVREEVPNEETPAISDGDREATQPRDEARAEPAADDPATWRERVESGSHQRFYRLNDFRDTADEPLSLIQLIESCERLALPWHYRHCGDGERRGETLPLSKQPEYREDAEQSCVILLEGAWSEVRREIRRLRYAGSRFSRFRTSTGGAQQGEPTPEIIAFITVVDPDEEMALEDRDRNSSLYEEVYQLPRPVLRAPSGRTVESHLATDLVDRWVEVDDLVLVFGNDIIPRLYDLANQDLILAEPRTDVEKEAFAYETKLFLRALARAVGDEKTGEEGLLPRPVAQVELTSERAVRLFDRTSSQHLRLVDADSANFLYYPGRIFHGETERYLVVGPAASEGEPEDLPSEEAREYMLPERSDEPPVVDDGEANFQAAPSGQDHIEVEPILSEDLSSPRRRIYLEPFENDEGEEVRHDFMFAPDPFQMGRFPIEVALSRRVCLRTEHYATVRIHPRTGQIRQMHIYEEESRLRFGAVRLSTQALHLYPNPEPTAQSTADESPLRLGAARLIAAAMRLILPSIYRGGREGMEVLIDVAEEKTGAAHVLGPREGFVLFDLQAGGNGMAREIHRRGIELLLRLVRRTLERVLEHDRLVALYDQWGEPGEFDDEQAGITSRAEHQERRHQERDLRREALVWLDHHLRPEGGPAAFTHTGDAYGSGFEGGEGDIFDLGRAWHSTDNSVHNLLWVKHRWRLADGQDASLDVAFDRRTAEESRYFTENSKILEAYTQFYQEHLQTEAFKLPDGTHWGAPRSVWAISPEGKPTSGGDPESNGMLAGYHSLASAVAAHSWPAFKTLSDKLADESETVGEAAESRYRLATYLSRFVQGIPYSQPIALWHGLRPPISTMLYRRGDCDSKSLLLAILLKQCGIEAGLFVSFEEGHAIAAAAMPEPIDATSKTVEVHRDEQGRFASEEESTGKAEHYQRGTAAAKQIWQHLQAWSESVKLEKPPQFWADLPLVPDKDNERSNIYVPIESTAYDAVGGASVSQPTSWTFLPLVAIWRRVLLHNAPVATDRAEHGEEPL